MRKYLTIVLFLCCLLPAAQQPDTTSLETPSSESAPPCDRKGIRRYLTPAGWGGLYLNGINFTYNPGDTLVITVASKLIGLDIENFHGAAGCPIVIINEGNVKIGAGIKLSHCTYIKITGSGSQSKFGLNIAGNGTGAALEVTGRSSNIEIERVNVYNKAYGAWIKQEAHCADSLQYPNWWMDNISLHDCRFVNIGQDCLYLGSTSPNGQRGVFCNGKEITPVPLRLSNIRIYNNFIDSCNRTGIQLSGADRGKNEIYNNTVRRCGFELNQTQGSGIILGGMTRAWVHDNYIRQTFQHGIFLLGSGRSVVERNNIDSSGLLGKVVNDFLQPVGILADSRPTVPAGDTVTLVIRNNIVGKKAVIKNEHIVLYNSGNLFGGRTIITGNITQSLEPARVYVAPGIRWSRK